MRRFNSSVLGQEYLCPVGEGVFIETCGDLEEFASKGKAELVYRIDIVEYPDKELGWKVDKRKREYG